MWNAEEWGVKVDWMSRFYFIMVIDTTGTGIINSHDNEEEEVDYEGVDNDIMMVVGVMMKGDFVGGGVGLLLLFSRLFTFKYCLFQGEKLLCVYTIMCTVCFVILLWVIPSLALMFLTLYFSAQVYKWNGNH